MSIPTVQSLRRQNARVDHHGHAADVVAAMHNDGLALHCSHERSGVVWSLSNGKSVSPKIANLVIINHDVVSVGDALFQDMPAQTFCFVEIENSKKEPNKMTDEREGD
jgi:hypothetical protein